MINDEKKQLRKKVRQLKKMVPPEEKKARSNTIWEQLENLREFKNNHTIMVYWSMDDEVYTHDFVRKWSGRKKIILPSVKGDELELRVFEGMQTMQPGEGYGIPEPAGIAFTKIDEIGLIIVPGVAFDEDCNRLGRGKAYYDKLLKTASCTKIGVCFDFQIFPEVPVDKYDIRMDKVIAESEIWG